MQTILVPTDFSKNAYSALHYATQLFAEEKCEIIIVHSFESQVSNLTSRVDIGKTEAIVNELYDIYEAKCEEVKHQIVLDTNNNKHTYKTIATSLTLSRAINKLIVKENVSFAVMGSKGSTGAMDILVGSTTLTMIQKIKKATLLIIPQEMEYKSIDKIAFATGFKRPFSKKELEPLLYVSAVHNADIKVIHSYKKEKMTDAQRANFHQLFIVLKNANPENNWLSGDTDTYNAVTSYIHKEHIDLLVMINYKHNAFIRLFREATIKDIAKYTLVPFLIVPQGD